MDLSNLHNSLREDEASTLRRTRHLRTSEDELSAVFRSAATSLTTLYRQGVASNKASYEKGYAHAFAHVLELWENDRDWLKGYLQRRIEALEVDVDAEDDMHQAEDEGVVVVSTPVRQVARQSVKRSRSTSRSGLGGSSRAREEEEEAAQRRLHKLPTGSKTSGSALHTSFNFSSPIAYPPSHQTSVRSAPSNKYSPSSSTTTNNNGSSSTSSSSRTTSTNTAGCTTNVPSGGVIRTSNAATSRRRLQRWKGLRAGRDRLIEVERAHDDMIDQDEIDYDNDPNAWTDDDDPTTTTPSGRKKVVAWTDKSTPTTTTALPSSAAAVDGGAAANMDLDPETKVLERVDRRKRRKSTRNDHNLNNDHHDHHDNDAEHSHSLDEHHFLAYHS